MPNEQAAWDSLNGERKYKPSLMCNFVKIHYDDEGWEWGEYRVIAVQRMDRGGRFHSDTVDSLHGRFEKYLAEHEAEILAFCGYAWRRDIPEVRET
jgi:hypothetical protein